MAHRNCGLEGVRQSTLCECEGGMFFNTEKRVGDRSVFDTATTLANPGCVDVSAAGTQPPH